MPHVCPFKHGYLLDNWFRRALFNPKRLLAPYVRPGMTALDIGCGMGVNAIGLARMVGGGGRVLAVDIQPEMLDVLRKRAQRAGVAGRIETRLSTPESIGVDTQVGFAVAFWMVHEVPDLAAFMVQVKACLTDDAVFLMVEPRSRVSQEAFEREVAAAQAAGLAVHDRPRILLSRAVALRRSA